MESDLALVGGIIIGALGISSVMSAIVDGRGPRGSAVLLLLSGVMIWWAFNNSPGGYTFQTIPDAFIRVVSSILN